MDWKRLGRALLFPHIAIMIILIPIAVVFLVYSMIFMGAESLVSIVSYVLAFYTLTVWCFKIPYLIHFYIPFINNPSKNPHSFEYSTSSLYLKNVT